jgi:hypothetical protein
VKLLPVSPEVFMRLAGVVEIVVGAAILLGFARIFGWVAMAWLALIAAELAQGIERSPARVRPAPGTTEASARA